MSSLIDILRKSPQERRQFYEAVGIDKIVLDGNTFDNYGTFSFVWEKSYVKSPTRSGNGSIENLDSYSTFVTPHLQIHYNLITADDYRKLMKLDLAHNEHNLSCYDPLYNETINIKVYLPPEELPKLYTIAHRLQSGSYVEFLGVEDFTIEMIGTNSGASEFIEVTYHSNYPQGSNLENIEPITRLKKGDDLIIGVGANDIQNASPKVNTKEYKFKYWTDNINENASDNLIYRDNKEIILNNNLDLYAQWE